MVSRAIGDSTRPRVRTASDWAGCMMVRVQLRIEGYDLPGRTCAGGPGFPGYENIHVGVQRKDKPAELLDLQPGDARAVTWHLECQPVDVPGGQSLRGPYLQNRQGERFVYLSWGQVDDAGGFQMFRRAKLRLNSVEPHVMSAAIASGLLTVRVRMTDAKGHPASRPPEVTWSAPAAY